MSDPSLVDYVLVRRVVEGAAPATQMNDAEKHAAAVAYLARGYTACMISKRLSIGMRKATRWVREAA